MKRSIWDLSVLGLTFTLIIICGLSSISAAAEDSGGYSVYTVGGLKIVRLLDMNGSLPADALLGDREEIESLLPDGLCGGAIASYLFDTGNDVIMMDTGYGDLENGKMLENLQKAGYNPDDVTMVVFTHLHGDHVGGAIKDRKPIFNKAMMIVPEKELVFWSDKVNNFSKAPAMLDYTFDLVEEFMSLYPGRIVTFKEGEAVVDWLKPIAVSGHTAGHTMFELNYGNEKAFIWADIMHCPQVQAANPEIAVVFDSDPNVAVQSRRKALDLVSDTGFVVFGEHFLSPGVLTFRKSADGGYQYSPVLPD